jgi:hypothetical protein
MSMTIFGIIHNSYTMTIYSNHVITTIITHFQSGD